MGSEMCIRDRVHIVAMGDYIGGYMKSKTPSNKDQVLSPSNQRDAAKHLLAQLEPTLIIEGDHDAWHNKQDNDSDWLADFCRDYGFRFAQWGAQLNFISDSLNVRLLARHRFNGSRRVDTMNPQKQLHNLQGPAEIVALAHVHSNPGAQERYPLRRHEEPFYAVQTGTYKIHDEYAKKLGLSHGEYGVPCVLVIPSIGYINGYQDIDSGLAALRMANEVGAVSILSS